MNSGTILWNTQPLNPKPCSPVHSALKFSVQTHAVLLLAPAEAKGQFRRFSHSVLALKRTCSLWHHICIQLQNNKHYVQITFTWIQWVWDMLQVTAEASRLPQSLSSPEAHRPPRRPETPAGWRRDRRTAAWRRRCPARCTSAGVWAGSSLLSWQDEQEAQGHRLLLQAAAAAARARCYRSAGVYVWR